VTNRERASRWIAQAFCSDTITDSLTALLDEVERAAFDAGFKRGLAEGPQPSSSPPQSAPPAR